MEGVLSALRIELSTAQQATRLLEKAHAHNSHYLVMEEKARSLRGKELC